MLNIIYWPRVRAEKFHNFLPEEIRSYLKGRGIPATIIEGHLIGWNGERITIPVFGENRRKVLGFRYAKSPTDISDTPEVISDADLGVQLYGLDKLLRKPSRAVICDGEFNRLVLEAIVTECGPTMYQPQFSALDAVTMTTHPVVLQQAKAAIEIVLRRKISLVTPFENLTKAEVMASCPRPDLFPWTHSCISQRFGEHDGTCFGCVVRRLAALAAGVSDVSYSRDPIGDEDANGGNLMSLLTYSHDLLLRYDHMEEFEIQKIERYKKQDLFRRFALDNFAALHRLVQKRAAMRRSIRALHDQVVAVLGRSVLQARLEELEKLSVAVNWDSEPPR